MFEIVLKYNFVLKFLSQKTRLKQHETLKPNKYLMTTKVQ